MHGSAGLHAGHRAVFPLGREGTGRRMVVEVIDKSLLRRRMARAYARGSAGAGFLLDHAAAELADRVESLERSFETAITHGAQSPALANALFATGKVRRVFRLERTGGVLVGSQAPGIVGDEETLPLRSASIDLFTSALALQWTNDLPGALVQIRRVLTPGGLFLAAMTGGRTLAELREAFFTAETEIRGGASPRVVPAADLNDIGSLLQRAGFARPVADREVLTVRYESAFNLFRDLRAMGASNALVERERKPATRHLFKRVGEIYADRFSDPDGRVRATFEMIWLSGWMAEP
jgi:SAM-dependent methyltransferase